MENIYDVLILGGGPCGYTAALYCTRAGLSCAVIEKMSVGGQMALTDTVDNFPGFEDGVSGIVLGEKMQKCAERFGAVTIYDEITSAELSGEIKTAVGYIGTYSAKAVIIATGAAPRQLGIEGEDALVGRGLHYCAHCDGRFYKGKTAVVVGGGNSAVSDALYLSRLCREVILIHRRDTLRADKIYSAPLQNSENIRFIPDSTVTEYITDKKIIGVKIRNVKTEQTEDIMCDGVFVSVGRRPSSELFADVLPTDDRGYIIADESTKTPLSGVFAAGDVRTKHLRQIVTAASDGAVAAHFAEEYLSSL